MGRAHALELGYANLGASGASRIIRGLPGTLTPLLATAVIRYGRSERGKVPIEVIEQPDDEKPGCRHEWATNRCFPPRRVMPPLAQHGAAPNGSEHQTLVSRSVSGRFREKPPFTPSLMYGVSWSTLAAAALSTNTSVLTLVGAPRRHTIKICGDHQSDDDVGNRIQVGGNDTVLPFKKVAGHG